MTYNELTVLVPCHSLEDFPTELGDDAAASLLNAFSILWHPRLLAAAQTMPKWQRADEASDARPHRLVIVPKPSEEMVPSAWVERAGREGSVVVCGVSGRTAMLEAALGPLEIPDDAKVDPDLEADFLALGTVYLLTELLTRHMRNFSHLDEVHMEREVLAAARAALDDDREATQKHLQHCFEMLLECRERFYPVDCYLIDLCLIVPRLADDHFGRLLRSKAALNILGPAEDWETIAREHPEHVEPIKTAWRDGHIDLLGGEWTEAPTALESLNSIVWQLRRGRRAFQKLFERAPTVWARRRFGVNIQMPQLLHRFGYDAGIHFVMDDGTYPDEEQTKLKWEGADGTILDAFSRIPLAGDSASAFLRFPVRMAESMDFDHTAAVCFARWPELKTPWLNDLRRAHRYSPVLGKFATFDEFFRSSDAPGRSADFKASGYFSPFLVHAVASQQSAPISRYLDYWERQRRFERVAWGRGILDSGFSVFDGPDSRPPAKDYGSVLPDVEAAIEEADPDANDHRKAAADQALGEAEQTVSGDLKSQFAKDGKPGRGLLVVNHHSFPRTVAVEWPQETEPLSGGPVSHLQIDPDRAIGMVDLPPCGFLWLSAPPRTKPVTPTLKTPMAEGLVLRNDFFEVHLSEVTGGIGQIRTYRRSPNRLSHQLCFRFSHERTFTANEQGEPQQYKSYYSEMRMSGARILSAGPALGEIESTGQLVDPQNSRVLAEFRQRIRVWRGRPMIDLEIELDPKKLPEGDPWTNYYCCRFAWKDASAAITGSMQQGAHLIGGPRIESPHFIELADDSYRTTILTPGLPFYRKTGDRMLDSLLIVEGEQQRQFQFAIAVDHSFPTEAALDAFSPPLIIPTDTAPDGVRGGWMFQVSVRNVQLTRILPLETFEHQAPAGKQGYIVRLLETEGRRKQFQLKCFRSPAAARQCDFQGHTISTLKIEGDAVAVDIAPYEVCDVELLYEVPGEEAGFPK